MKMLIYRHFAHHKLLIVAI